MAKIVFNNCYGGFSLSEDGLVLFRVLGGVAEDARDFPVTRRHDRLLIKVVETLGKKADGNGADLRIMKVSPGTPYRIKNYDGKETVKMLDTSEWAVAL